jgi:hypothetical protein
MPNRWHLVHGQLTPRPLLPFRLRTSGGVGLTKAVGAGGVTSRSVFIRDASAFMEPAWYTLGITGGQKAEGEGVVR